MVSYSKEGQLFGIVGRVGITSSIFGFLFGSVFGHETLLNPVHQSLFGVRDKLFEVMASSSTMVLLIGAIAIGAVLILVTMIMNMWNRARKKEWAEFLFSQNGVAGFVFYGFIIVAAVLLVVAKVNVLKPLFVVPFYCCSNHLIYDEGSFLKESLKDTHLNLKMDGEITS